MADKYDVAVKVVSQKGTCVFEHKVGDEWIVGGTAPAGLCLPALSALLPFITALRFGGSFYWESNPDVTTFACPDVANPVVFELRRLRNS